MSINTRQQKRPDNEYQVCSYRLVGAMGFEPMIFRSRTERDTKLRYAPN